MTCFSFAPHITKLGAPPLVQTLETTVFSRASVQVLLSVASTCAVVGMPAVNTGFTPAVPLDAPFDELFVLNQADSPPVRLAADVDPAAGITLAVKTASISRFNSLPCFVI